MKYIKLYEAFESEVITNTIKFLTKKIGQKSTNSFFGDIKKLMTQYDVPISRIKEDDLEYIRVSKAIKVKSDVPVDNNWDIYCIKYWFSLEKGFLGKTCTGNITTPYVKLSDDYSYKNRNFSEYQFYYIKDSLGITKGKLSSVLRYEDLKTGDDVFAILGYDSDSDRVAIGKIYIDTQRSNAIFLYNNYYSDGTYIHGERPDFADNYTHSWRLASEESVDGDHHRLHFYTKDNRSLRQETKIIKVKHKPNLADFNKPLSDRGSIINWTRGSIINWTKDNQHLIEDCIGKADFAIIIYMDKLLSIPSTNTIKLSRRDARQGATALMSDYDIKQININNYTTKLVAKYGLHKDSEDFSKLNKFINNTMCNKFIMFNLHSAHTIGSLNSIIDHLYRLVNENDKEYYFNNVLTAFKNSRDRTKNVTEVYIGSLDVILKSGDENLITLVKRFINLGERINKYIESIDIENIHDIIMIKYKLKAIEGFLSDNKNKLATPYNDVMNSFDSGSTSMSRYVSYCEDATDEFEYSMEKLVIIEKFVNSLLK